MTLITNRRSLLLGAGAMGAGALLGLGAFPRMAKAAPNKGGLFRIGIADFDSGDTLDPQLAESRFMMHLGWQLRNCLVEVGPGVVLVPELAESWDSNDDLTVWTFKLRQGVEFHNAKTMTAEDVVYSINLHRGEKTVSESKALIEQVTDVKTNAPGEVTITLAGPNAGFPSLMSLVNLQIVPEGETDFGKGVGTGGYILESFEPGVRSRVKRNPNYWKADRANFDEIEIIAIKDVTARTTALQTGEIDAMNAVDATTAALLKQMPGMNLIQTQGKAHYCFEMNTTAAPYDNIDVRTALKLAIDRQEILDKVLGGYGSIANDQPISPAYQYYNADIPQHSYDPEKAAALIKKAGAEGQVFQLSVSETPFTGAVNTAELYKEQAAKAGIQIEVVREPEDGYWSNVWAKKPFAASKWSGRVNEDVMLSLAYSKEAIGSWNSTYWDNEAFNKALVAARSERDEAKRKALYFECQALIHDDGGLIAPVWADFLDAKSEKIATGEIASDWDMDGCRAGERWWMA